MHDNRRRGFARGAAASDIPSSPLAPALGDIRCMSRDRRRIKMPTLRYYQRRILQEWKDDMRGERGETFTLLLPRQAGKNELAAALMQTLLRTSASEGGSAVAAAPTFSPQGAIGLERTRAAFEHTDRVAADGGAVRLEGSTLVSGRTRAHFLSGSPEAHVAGHTASIALFADEAQEIDADWFDRQFRPMAASTAAPTLLYGTPWDGTTLLDEAVARNRDREAREGRGYPSFHHQVRWEDIEKRRAAYGRFIRNERDRLGARNPIFRTQYGLETVDSAGSFFSAEALAAIEGTHERLREPVAHERYVGGLDAGGDGARADASVLTIARVCPRGRCEVVDLRVWQGIRLSVLENEVAKAAREWRLERLVVDATGIGAGLWDGLARELTAIEVEKFVFRSESKSELGHRVLMAADGGRLALFANDATSESLACRGELRRCRRKSSPDGRMQWAAPGNEHDDYVISLALALHAVQGAGEPRVAIGRRR